MRQRTDASRNKGFLLAYRSLLAAECASDMVVSKACELAARRDIVIVSDVDEIPRPQVLLSLVGTKDTSKTLEAGKVFAMAAGVSIGFLRPDGHGCTTPLQARAVNNWHYGPKVLTGESLLLLGGQTVRYGWVHSASTVQGNASWHLSKMLMSSEEHLHEICSFPDRVSVIFCGPLGHSDERKANLVARVAAAVRSCKDVYGRHGHPMHSVNVSLLHGMPSALAQVMLEARLRIDARHEPT